MPCASTSTTTNQLLGCNCTVNRAPCNNSTAQYMHCSTSNGLCVFDQSQFPPTTTGAKIVVTRVPRTHASTDAGATETTMAAQPPMSLSTIIIICVASFVGLGLVLLVVFWLYMRHSSLSRQEVLAHTQSMQYGSSGGGGGGVVGGGATDINQRVRSMQIQPNQVGNERVGVMRRDGGCCAGD